MIDELTGAMVERVAIETFVDARDDAGASVGDWQGRGSAWAAITPVGATDGRSDVQGEARQSRRRWRVTLRQPAQPIGLTSRLIWRGQWLAVIAIESDPRRPDRVMLRCEARGA